MASTLTGSTRSRLVVAVAIGAAFATGGTAVLAANAASDQDVQATIDSVFAGQGCVSPDSARAGLEARLVADGFADWTVESRADKADCVTAGPIEPERAVVLLPVNGPDVSAAMEQVRLELMDRCLNEAEATAFVSQALTTAGVTDFEVITDGPLGYPRGQEEAVMKHLEAGCFIYSGTGHDADGTPVFGINGGSVAQATPSGG